ncbi:hypothetical protein [Robertkochia solimangrovi]|uniref:hypothetical protein n=1 Tax=Robertkochia solimangrovi TaxID=2213046 RepID=UPI00117C6468|nr:hypothetical protein [Robertkochia solimangrovi]TRZ42253.1 hypothetical protein DMZ48_14590 [Robertkochia solimangrovi]
MKKLKLILAGIIMANLFTYCTKEDLAEDPQNLTTEITTPDNVYATGDEGHEELEKEKDE